MELVNQTRTTFEKVKPLTLFFVAKHSGDKATFHPYYKMHNNLAVCVRSGYTMNMLDDSEVVLVALHPEYKQFLKSLLEGLD